MILRLRVGRLPVFIRLCLLCLTVSVVCGNAQAYRFNTFANERYIFPIVGRTDPWDPDVWGAGEKLSFVLVDSPEWDAVSTDVREVRRLLNEALRAWSGVPGADIDWEVGEIVSESPDVRSANPHFIRVSTAFGRTVAHIGSGARHDGRFHVHRIGVSFHPSSLRNPVSFRYTLLHELGHTLGLGHAGVYSPAESWLRDGLSPQWRRDPIMSYGHRGDDVRYSAMMTLDDRVGAALARPGPRLLETTGNIRGTVVAADGTAARFAHLIAARIRSDGSIDEGVGRFTNAFGEFVIGGLPPGDYVLMVRSLVVPSAHVEQLAWADRDIRTLLGRTPVSVRAGRRAGPITIVVQRGEPGGLLLR